MPGAPVVITGAAGTRWNLRSDNEGEFEAILPYGEYEVAEAGARPVSVSIRPFETTRCNPRQEILPPEGASWSADLRVRVDPPTYSLAGLLRQREPTTVTEPLDFGGLAGNVLPLVSLRAFSWTATRYALQGMTATDSYQPGRPVVFPDTQAMDEVVVRTGLDLGTARAYGSEIGIFIRQATPRWHGQLASANTGSALAADNLPPPGERGFVLRPEKFLWYTRDHLQIGGPVTKRADLFVSGTGQWASETAPPARVGNPLDSRLLFGNARGRVRLSGKDRLDAQLTGSRINRSGWNLPAGIEALAGHRGAPPLIPMSGLVELDHLDFVQTGWTRQLPGSSRAGSLEVRYSYSTAHLDTRPSTTPVSGSRIEMAGGEVAGPPPLWNMAVRTRHAIGAALVAGAKRHQFAAGGGWDTAGARNRFAAPFDLNVIAANGVPVTAVELNTPLDSRTRIQTFSLYGQDRVALTSWLSLDMAAVADFERGSLPAQSSPAGVYAPAGSFTAQPGVISWNSVSPRLGLAFTPPGFRRLVLRGGYLRLYGPLAGRYLDFANPNSLSGSEYSVRSGQVLRRFGGMFSRIDANLKRPCADEFDITAEISLPRNSYGRVLLYRRDDKRRIAAINTGVPFADFRPLAIVEPFEQQRLTVFEQDPATLGQDFFLLTNPADLRMQYKGFLAEIGTRRRDLEFRASFLAEKSFGPTNPGNAPWENDPGVVGALFADPNTLVNAAGHDYFDRAFVGKMLVAWRLPGWLRRFEAGSIVTYLDGLVFGRRLLVTGLSQGPVLVNATIRGSPEGGHRAEYVLDWDMRLSFSLGPLRIAADVFNAANINNKLRENAISGPDFAARPALALEPPRFLRLGLQYRF